MDETRKVLSDHARLQADIELRRSEVPIIIIDGLIPEQKVAFSLAQNKLGDLSTFDPERLTAQLKTMVDVSYDFELKGFTTAEVDLLLEPTAIGAVTASGSEKIDKFDLPEPDGSRAMTARSGYLRRVGRHRALCASALDPLAYPASSQMSAPRSCSATRRTTCRCTAMFPASVKCDTPSSPWRPAR